MYVSNVLYSTLESKMQKKVLINNVHIRQGFFRYANVKYWKKKMQKKSGNYRKKEEVFVFHTL